MIIDDLVAIRSEIYKASSMNIDECMGRALEYHQIFKFDLCPPKAKFFRARKLDEAHYDKYHQLSEMLYPRMVRSVGRCNDLDESILYASLNRFSIFDEIEVVDDDRVQVVVLGIKDNAILRAYTIGEIARCYNGRDMLGREISSSPLKKSALRAG